jgi:hypothetical protein
LKNFYRQLKIIQDRNNFDHATLTDYIHRQKNEVSAHLSITPDFWVAMDYAIHLTSAILKKPKIEAEKDIVETIKPLFESYNRKIELVYRKIPEKEYFFLKKDMKSFHHIICHSINLIDKGLPHFLPSYLFIESIQNMSVLYPLHEKTCDPCSLARNNYPLLLSRYISFAFANDIKEIIDFIVWMKCVIPHAIKEDRIYLRNKMISKIESFVKEKHEFKNDPKYSTRELIIELREVITLSYIRDKMGSLLDRIKTPGAKVSLSECIEHISSIFLDTKNLVPLKHTVRDLAISINLIVNIVNSVKEGNNKELYKQLFTAKTLVPFFKEVTRYMLDPKTEIEFLKFIEIIEFMEDSYPSKTFSVELVEILENIRKSLETEKELIASSDGITHDVEAMSLFIAKMKQIYVKN